MSNNNFEEWLIKSTYDIDPNSKDFWVYNALKRAYEDGFNDGMEMLSKVFKNTKKDK